MKTKTRQKSPLLRKSSPQPHSFPSAITASTKSTNPLSPTIYHATSKPKHSKRRLSLSSPNFSKNSLQNPSRDNLLCGYLLAVQPLFQQNEPFTFHKCQFCRSQHSMHSASRSNSESDSPLLLRRKMPRSQQTSYCWASQTKIIWPLIFKHFNRFFALSRTDWKYNFWSIGEINDPSSADVWLVQHKITSRTKAIMFTNRQEAFNQIRTSSEGKCLNQICNH